MNEFRRRQDRLLGLLKKYAYEKRQVTLRSGRVSDFYIDCRQALLTAEGHFLVGSLVLEAVRDWEIEAVGGVSVGADPIASATSTMSWISGRPLGAFYIRKEPKGHGTQAYLEGLKGIRPHAHVAIVEDVITTGASTIAAIQRARDAGLVVVGVVAVVDRQEDRGYEAVERALQGEWPPRVLFRRSDFEDQVP